MDPSLLGFYVALGPHVVCPVEYESRLVSEGDAKRSEAICPFSTPTFACLEQLDHAVISRKSGCLLASGALIEFNTLCHSLEVLCSALPHVFERCCSTTEITGRLIGPPKELLFVPSQQCLELGDLLSDAANPVRNNREADPLRELVVILLNVLELAPNSIHKCLLLISIWSHILALKRLNLFGHSCE